MTSSNLLHTKLETCFKKYNDQIIIEDIEDGLQCLLNEDTICAITELDIDEINNSLNEIQKVSDSTRECNYIYTKNDESYMIKAIYFAPDIPIESTIHFDFFEPFDVINCKVKVRNISGDTDELIYCSDEYKILSDNFVSKLKQTPHFAEQTEFKLEEIFRKDIAIIELKIPQEEIKESEIFSRAHDIINQCLVNLSFEKNINLYIPDKHSTSVPVEVRQEESIKLNLSSSENLEAYRFFLDAEKNMDIRFKYLDYYYVIEYFFYGERLKTLESLIEKVIRMEKIKAYNLVDNYERLSKLRELFNELEDLEKNSKEKLMFEQLVQSEYVSFDNLIKSVGKLSRDDTNILKNTTLGLKTTAINENIYDSNGECKQLLTPDNKSSFLRLLTNRLYEIRNYIVHSTKYKVKTDHQQVYTSDIKNGVTAVDIKFIRTIAYLLLTSNLSI